MDALQDIIERTKRLTPAERRRLIHVVERDLPSELEEPETKEHEERRLAALDRFIAMAGTGHSDYTDVSSNTHKHLAEIYADNHLPTEKK